MNAPAHVAVPRSELLTAALSYAARGWRVLPLHWIEDGTCSCRRMYGNATCPAVPGKHPIEKTGKDHEAGTTIEFVVRQWWRRWPLANIAIVTGIGSGLLVLDVDAKSGGLESLAKLQAERGPFPETPTVYTPGGGCHLYFKHPGREQIKGAVGFLPGLDWRADGNIAVAPPSVLLAGAYRWK